MIYKRQGVDADVEEVGEVGAYGLDVVAVGDVVAETPREGRALVLALEDIDDGVVMAVLD